MSPSKFLDVLLPASKSPNCAMKGVLRSKDKDYRTTVVAAGVKKVEAELPTTVSSWRVSSDLSIATRRRLSEFALLRDEPAKKCE